MRASTSASQACGSTGALAAAIGACEQPGLASERDAAQRTLGRIVRETDPSFIEEARHRRPPPPASVAIVVVSVAGSTAPVIRIRDPFVNSNSIRRRHGKPVGAGSAAIRTAAKLEAAATVEAAAVAIHTVGLRGSRPPAPPGKRWLL